MNIAGVTGISDAPSTALKALGAVEGAALVEPVQTTELEGASVPSAPPHNLPAPLTPIVGPPSWPSRLSCWARWRSGC